MTEGSLTDPNDSDDAGRDPARQASNHVPLTPLDFLERAGDIWPGKVAVSDGELSLTYEQVRARSRALAGAIRQQGIRTGDVVSFLGLNRHYMIEAHFGVPLAGAILNAINTRLDAAAIAAMLRQSQSRLLVIDRSLLDIAEAAAARLASPPELVVARGSSEPTRYRDYEAFLASAAPADFTRPSDEWNSIALNYTSGTTSAPKGVLYSHRGAYLNALGNVINFGLSADSVFLWTLPMFHCNGWSFPWALTAVGGRHICLDRIEPGEIFTVIREQRVSHLCAAPVVLKLLIESAGGERKFEHGRVKIATGGAAPPSATIEAIERLGFEVTHLYGLTESYGPSTSCVPQPEWSLLGNRDRARLMARQGVRSITLADQAVLKDDRPVPMDGETIGELALRGNTVMKGYFRAPRETAEALGGGWLHTGDLAVVHPDGYVEIKDRAKDIIISGGENISSLEVEEVLHRHAAVAEAAVVAAPHDKWGETPVAFVSLRAGIAPPSEFEILGFCRTNLAHFKCPTSILFEDIPKTATGKVEKHVLRAIARERMERVQTQSPGSDR